ncbi:molybdate ABC transporter substrate-binding protein [Polynucleobacter wuianus]|uniref:Molybdate ABC transporter substrate-binding protein n=1 Tax=Polynucleobacter wuianus TaxID=1743168 RepID=A0A191UDW2_9BURK|nr:MULTISPECIES: molybdate ABC transporter substrate-binding protein [Polynucleobacter]ANI99248.1 molybdate ABC transporter substrate-binding protein [Polynucleobacter wuianus]MBU3552170.1 molybdate ABC transporter substrate-binding protein [Polynucleobacter sp. MWH-Post4-6-1]MBU3608939.1 molybdate ABC transporter substrate-binding protein [Polynucleobacter wuianus]
MPIRLLSIFASLLLFANLTFAQGTTIAVAANMKDAFGEIAAAFKATGKPEMRVVYGSSGNFTTQIMNGAPFNLFIAADEHFPLELYKNGKAINEGAVYAIGRLVLIAKTSSGITLSDSKAEITKAIAKANKIAIAKPELAPYGKAAVEYLKAEGLWDLAKDKLIYGDNIGVSTTYVVSGAANLGFTALSLAKSPEVSKENHFILVDSKLYQPIAQRMVLIKGAPQEAQDLYQFMQGSQAKSILRKYGFTTP